MTVHGALDGVGAAHLDLVLTDLIDGQGNLSVVVDLRDLTATGTDADRLSVFVDAARRAHRHSGVLALSTPPALFDEALERLDADHLVHIAPHVEPAASSGRHSGTVSTGFTSNPDVHSHDC